jgi:hypothetical protein
MTSVNVSEGVNEVIGRMVPSFNATSGAAVGPYRESRLSVKDVDMDVDGHYGTGSRSSRRVGSQVWGFRRRIRSYPSSAPDLHCVEIFPTTAPSDRNPNNLEP